MNPQWHDEFVTLCALFPSGELTEEEWALLQVHLAYCDSCQRAFREYQQLAADVIPVMALGACSEAQSKPEAPSFSIEEAERRLMGQLESVPPPQESANHSRIIWRTAALVVAAGMTCLAGLHFVRSNVQGKPQAPVVSSLPPRSIDPPDDLKPQLELAQAAVARLQQQLAAAEERYRQTDLAATGIEQQLAAEQEERKKMSAERDALNQQLAIAQTEAQSLRDKSTVTNANAGQEAARTAALEAKVRDLNAALEEKDRMLAVDKDFLAHDREIRDLIAARDLYVADIFDVGQNGKTTKPFGRVFYTKDRSLVFYGYDLDKQAGLNQSVAFQAWGSGDDKQNVSLGLFYQDDSDRRWVLRFNDKKTLARLNMVFVTAEPQGGSAKPTGKPLLLAYLQIQPNHP